MASTYTPIATANGTGSSTVISFTSIPQTYTDLVLVCNSITSASGVNNTDIGIRFNNDSSFSSYSRTILYAYSGGISSARSTRSQMNEMYIDYYGAMGSSTYPGLQVVNIMNYSNTTTYKTVLTRSNNAYSNGGVDMLSGTWASTSAITQIDTVVDSGSNIATTAMFTLYGIKAA